MIKRDPELFSILVILALLLGTLVAVATLDTLHQSRVAQSCIEQGKEWIEGSCANR